MKKMMFLVLLLWFSGANERRLSFAVTTGMVRRLSP